VNRQLGGPASARTAIPLRSSIRGEAKSSASGVRAQDRVRDCLARDAVRL
jgi:hypothetical protein